MNGERLPLEGGTDRFDVQQLGEVSSQCDVVIVPSGDSPGGDSEAHWRLPVIIVCAIIGVCLIAGVILLLVVCVRRRRRLRHSKGKRFFAQRISNFCFHLVHSFMPFCEQFSSSSTQ